MLWVVAAALINDDGRVLLQQRPEGKALAGLWEYPGGKIDIGEAPEGALIREINEELGLELSPGHLHPLGFATDDQVGVTILLYACRAWTGEPKALDGQHFEWLKRAELSGKAMPPIDVALTRQLLARFAEYVGEAL